MSVLAPAELSDAQWSFLVAALKSEASLGAAPAGTVSANRLTGIQYVGASFSLWSRENPAIGVQLRSVKEGYTSTSLRAGTNRHALETTFDIIIGIQSTPASAGTNMGLNTPANAEDAMNQLRQYISGPIASPGSGISAVLRDPQYRLLGSTGGQVNAVRSQIVNIDYEWEVGQGENAQIWAYAAIVFIAEALVSIG